MPNYGLLGYSICGICPSFQVCNAEVLTSCCKTNMLALGVMVRLASFSSTAVMSASPCAGSRRARQLNKPLGDPDSREEMILPQDTVWQTHTNTYMHTRALGKVKQVGLKMHIHKASDTVYTPTQRLIFLVAWTDFVAMCTAGGSYSMFGPFNTTPALCNP